MAGKARALYEELRRAVVAEYDDSGQIGRRYRRQDEIGTPYALTIDEQTLEDDTVTIRDRDSLAQERIPISGARALPARQARAGLAHAEGRVSSQSSPGRFQRSRYRPSGSAKPNVVEEVGVRRVQDPFRHADNRAVVEAKRTELDAEPAAAVAPRARKRRRR